MPTTLFFFTLPTLFLSIVYASFFEWVLHKYFMHRPFGKFDYAFKAHALVHHSIFKADRTYHLANDEDKHTIPMAWWNGPFLILLSGIPFDFTSWYFGTWNIAITAMLSIGAYYGAYEYLHWCMHLPKWRRLEFSWIFRRLNGHHLLHHRYMWKNFNVVLPLADLCLGTLLPRSPVWFAHPEGQMIPNVCPPAPQRAQELSVCE
ncbi:MAG TPA: fatty acid hydroxylase [Candidatus Paceibacterota bacterium]